jgi:hypothetical protein
MAKQRAQGRERYPNGRIKPKSRKQVRADRTDTVLKYRQRYLAAPGEDATDPRFGSVVGKLSLQKIISLTQYDAALEYERIRREYLGLKIEGRPTSACQLAAMVFGTGRSTGPEISDKAALSKTDYHNNMMDRLKDVERVEGQHFALIDLLDRVTVYDLEMALTPANVASLRSALNVLAKYFQYVRD